MKKSTPLLLLAAAMFVACERTHDSPADSGQGTSAAPNTMAAPALSYADVAGKWNVKLMPAVGDSVLMTYEVTATADSTGWTTTFPGRPPISMHVMPPTGDSIVTHMGPYESALRKGVQVTTTAVLRIRDGKLMGTADARYSTAPDSVVKFRMEGTRM